MKFIVDKQSFHKAVSTVDGIISAREIRSIVSNVLIEASGGKLTLTATDLEMGMKTSIEAEIEEPGKIALPAKMLSQTLREFRGSKISFSIESEVKVIMSDASGTSQARITLMGTGSEEFPVIPTLTEDQYMKFPSAISMEMIRKTGYAIAEEDARYVFNGLYMINEGKNNFFVATDGRRLARIDREFPEVLPFKDGIIFPNKAVRELQKVLDHSEEGQVAFDPKDRRVYFRIGNVDLITKLIDGSFPDYNQVIPKKIDVTLKINRLELINSLKQVAVMAAEPSRQVKINFNNDTLLISAATPDLGEATDSMAIEYQGEEVVIAFNSHYLLDVLKVIQSDQIELGFSSGSAPALVRDPEDSRFVSVIMPMKI